VLDLQTKTVKYYASEKSSKEKNGFELGDLERCFIPQQRDGPHQFTVKHSDKKFMFVLETAQRTFYCQALSEGSQRIWAALLGSIGDFNESQKAPAQGVHRGASRVTVGLASASPSKAAPGLK
jgi:hypothetical protein